MKKLFFALAIGSIVGVSAFTMTSCRTTTNTVYDTVYVHDGDNDDDSTASTILVNGGFNEDGNVPVHDLMNGEMQGWNVYKGSPQRGSGPGKDGKSGFMQMWGNGDATLGEGIVQDLQTPISAGKSYQVSCDLAWMNDNPDNYTPYTRVRFTAYDDMGNAETIGTLQTDQTSWTTLTTPVWTASRRYTHFAVTVEDDNVGTNSATWAHVDNVALIQK